MNKLSLVFVAALSLAAFGCKKKGGDCASAINHSMELSKADMSKMPGMDDKMLGKLKDLGVQHCKDDKWSDDAIKCMNDAKAEADAKACYSKLSNDQQEKMNKAMMDAMTASAPPAPTGTAPAGSGEAGSGSAGSAEPPK